MCRPTVTQQLQKPAGSNSSMWMDMSFKPMNFEQFQQNAQQVTQEETPVFEYALDKQSYTPEQFVPQEFVPQDFVTQPTPSFPVADAPVEDVSEINFYDENIKNEEPVSLENDFSDILFDDSELMTELDLGNGEQPMEKKRKFEGDDGYSSAEDLLNVNIDPLPFDQYQVSNELADILTSDSEVDEEYTLSPKQAPVQTIPQPIKTEIQPTNTIDEEKPVFDESIQPQLRPNANKPAKIGKDGEEVVRSRFKGVRWYKRTSKWVVQIRINGTRKHIGYYSNEEDAGKAYTLAMKGAKEEKVAKSNARKRSRKN